MIHFTYKLLEADIQRGDSFTEPLPPSVLVLVGDAQLSYD